MHSSRIHQHVEKNSVPLKEVLTRGARARTRVNGNTKMRARDDANVLRKSCSDASISQEIPVAQDFLLFTQLMRSSLNRSHRKSSSRLKGRCANFESRFLAIKKFSCPAALLSRCHSPKPHFCANRRGLIRIAFSRSRDASSFMVNEWCTPEHVTKQRGDHLRAWAQSNVQMPSLVLSRSFTACGLALPPDDFIT